MRAKRKRGEVLYGWKYESLEEKIKYMLSLSLEERYIQNLIFAEFMNLAKKKEDYGDTRKAFRTLQIIRKK